METPVTNQSAKIQPQNAFRPQSAAPSRMWRTALAGAVGGAVVAIAAMLALNAGGADEQSRMAASERAGPRGPASRRGGYAPAVNLAKAEAAAIIKQIDVIGEARASLSVAITSETTGLVEQVLIAPGKRVRKGDVLVRLEDDAQAIALARTDAQFPIAKSNAERFKALAADGAASAIEAEQALYDYKALEAELREARFALAQRTIKAPFDGVAGLTPIEPGDYLRAGDTVTTLDDTSSLIIEFSVPQESAAFVDIGQAVQVALTSEAALGYEGAISALDSRIDPASRSLRVEATVNNPRGRLLPGAVVTVSTQTDGAPAVAVPGLAVQWDRAGAFVWTRTEDGVAERRRITILQRNDDVVLVEGALTAGDIIVADGADRVRSGSPLPNSERLDGGDKGAFPRSDQGASAPGAGD